MTTCLCDLLCKFLVFLSDVKKKLQEEINRLKKIIQKKAFNV